MLFSAPMVLAILAGVKTQTRRVLRMPPKFKEWAPCERDGMPSPDTTVDDAGLHIEPYTKRARTNWEDCYDVIPCPYGRPGDRLWVKETFAFDAHDERPVYRASHPGAKENRSAGPEVWRWRPSIYMPREVSRITLEVTGVRVEWLQSITEIDARAEGVGPLVFSTNADLDRWATWTKKIDPQSPHATMRGGYAALWESINGIGSWAANPWVWVVEFRRIH